MQITEVAQARSFAGGNARSRNMTSRVLLQGDDTSPNNYSMNITTVDEPHPTPRHRHNTEQVRFALSGTFEYAPGKSIPSGQLMYFPESVYYGPQIRLDSTVITTQFGGASGNGFLSERQRRAAYNSLSARGKFEKGLYTWVDETGRKHNADTFDLIWEFNKGEKPHYPEKRYEDLVLIDPEAFSWIEAPAEPGIAYKHLGSFTERDFQIAFIRLERGATLTVTADTAPKLMVLMEGTVATGARTYAAQTAFGLARADGAVAFMAERDSWFYFLKLHTF